MIYRIIGESVVRIWTEETGEMELGPGHGRLMGAYNAELGGEVWGELPMPELHHSRARFWFTEAGWRRYGKRVAAAARASGRSFRVLKSKNPPPSSVVYRDEWQVAVLPSGIRRPK